MSHRPPRYLFFLTREALYRVDLDGPPDGAPARIARNADERAPGLLGRGLAGVAKRTAAIVFLEEAWCQPLALPVTQIGGPDDPDLASILPLEAEAFSGLSSEKAITVWSRPQEIDGAYQFLVLQAESSLTEELAAVLRKKGIALTGLSNTRFLQGDGQPPLPFAPEELPVLLARYRSSPETLPLIVPKAPPPSQERLYWISLALALLAAAGCWAVHGNLSRRCRRLAVEEGECSRLKAEHTALTGRIRSIRSEIDTAVRTEEEAKALREKLRRARTLLPTMVEAVAEAAPGTMMIRSLASDGPFTLRVSGFCASAEDADAFFVKCGSALATSGWKVVPEEVSAALPKGQTGLVRFTCLFKPPFEIKKAVTSDEEDDW